jgi:hypothetical protein
MKEITCNTTSIKPLLNGDYLVSQTCAGWALDDITLVLIIVFVFAAAIILAQYFGFGKKPVSVPADGMIKNG